MGRPRSTINESAQQQLEHKQTLAYAEDLAKIFAAEKEKRQALEVSFQKLEAVFANIPAGLVVTDPDYVIRQVNPGFCRLLRVKQKAVIGYSLFDVGFFLNLGDALTDMEQSAETSGAYHVMLPGPAADSRYDLLTTITKIQSKRAKNLGWVLMFQDNSQQQQVDNMKDQFIAMASQELRAPVDVLRSATDLLVRELSDERAKTIAPVAEMIRSAVRQLNHAFSVLLDMSEAAQDVPASRRQNVNIIKLLKDAIAKVKKIAAENDVTVVCKVPPSLSRMKGIPTQIGTAFYHLLLHAVNASPHGAKVVCTVEETKTMIKVKVRDFGPGIPDAELSRIFTKFSHPGGRLTHSVTGLSSGLPLVKQIATTHRGKVTVRSTVGRGSLFTISFPKGITEQDECENLVDRLRRLLDAEQKQSLVIARDLATLMKRQK